MSTGYDSLDDIEVKKDKADKFKVEEGFAYRIGFPLLNDNGRVAIQRVDFYTYEDKDEKFHAWQKSENEEVNKKSEKAGADLKTRYVTAIVVYRTDKAGKPLLPLTWDVKPLVLDNKKLAALKAINAEWDLTTVDLSVTSPNPKMHEHTYTPLKTAIWRLKDAEQLKKVQLPASIEADVLVATKEVAEIMSNSIAFKFADSKILSTIGVESEEEKEADDLGTGASAQKDSDFDNLTADDI